MFVLVNLLGTNELITQQKAKELLVQEDVLLDKNYSGYYPLNCHQT
jgi:hypothetical protein